MNSFIIADTTDITDIINKNILLNNFIHTTKFCSPNNLFFSGATHFMLIRFVVIKKCLMCNDVFKPLLND
jgi:hypothetical protein